MTIFFSFRIQQKLGKTNYPKNSANNWCPVTTLIGKIAANSPAAQLKEKCAAPGPAADLTLEHIGVNLSRKAKIS